MHGTVSRIVLWYAAQVQYVIAPDEHLAEVAGELPIDPFFCARQLQVHVRIHGDEIPCGEPCARRGRRSEHAACTTNLPRVARRVFGAPLYSIPHLSFAMTGLPVKSLRKGLGLTGICTAGKRRVEAQCTCARGFVERGRRGAARRGMRGPRITPDILPRERHVAAERHSRHVAWAASPLPAGATWTPQIDAAVTRDTAVVGNQCSAQQRRRGGVRAGAEAASSAQTANITALPSRAPPTYRG